MNEAGEPTGTAEDVAMKRVMLVIALVIAACPGGASAVVSQNDAGSGQDAPDGPHAQVWIAPGTVYDGMLTGLFADDSDWYAFTASIGQTVDALVASPLACGRLYDSAGTQLEFSCSVGTLQLTELRAVLPQTGTYFLEITYLEPQVYRFSFALDGVAPEPLAATGALIGKPERLPPVSPASTTDDHVVVAVVDTGVNPYHSFFRAPSLTPHPSTWLDGFPADAQTLDLSLGSSNYTSAREADEAIWSSVQRSTYSSADDAFDEHLYTIPGTRIVAAISFGEYEDTATGTGENPAPVIDDHGHGTNSVGLAAGADLPSAEGNVLIVSVEIGRGSFHEGIRWAARQPWIDALSLSLGAVANVPTSGPDEVTKIAADSGKPVFIAAGNGLTSTGIAPDHCTTYSSAYAGPPWVTRIGAAVPESDQPTWWHCLPVDAIARTNITSPSYNVIDGSDNAGGTSAATPNVAGNWASVMLEARRSGSGLPRNVVLEHLLREAEHTPYDPSLEADPSVGPVAWFDQGYGFIDGDASARAIAAIAAGTPPKARPDVEAWFSVDKRIREALWGDSRDTVPGDPLEQNDANSGRDAGDSQATAVRVASGASYDAMLSIGLWDTEDRYVIDVQAGDGLNFKAAAPYLCYSIFIGDQVATDCSTALVSTESFMIAETSGTASIQFSSPIAQRYRFSLGTNEPAPDLN